MYISLFSLTLVIFYYSCPVLSYYRSCTSRSDCYRQGDHDIYVVWECCEDNQCYRYNAGTKFFCPCYRGTECARGKACYFGKCENIRSCVNDSNCYQHGERASWKCCEDKKCYMNKEGFRCPCYHGRCAPGQECYFGKCEPIRRCVNDSNCYQHGERASWKCCEDKKCYMNKEGFRCPCYHGRCAPGQECYFGKCEPIRRCVNDSNCYRDGESASWKCCGDKRCYRKYNSGKHRCSCSTNDDCSKDEVCKSYRGYKVCETEIHVPPGKCRNDGDCGEGFKSTCYKDEKLGYGSCGPTSGILFIVIFHPVIFTVFVIFFVVCLNRQRIRDRLARVRDRRLAARAQYNLPRVTREETAAQATEAQSADTSSHIVSPVSVELRRPTVRPPQNQRSRLAREETASQATELQSASTSSRNDSTVTVGQRLTPSAPPLAASENHTSTEEARDATITLDTEEHAGIAVSSAATTGSSDLPSYNELQNRDEEPPPPSYEEVIRNYSAERLV